MDKSESKASDPCNRWEFAKPRGFYNVPEGERALPVKLDREFSEGHEKGRGMVFMTITFPPRNDSEVDPFEFLDPDLREDVREAGYLAIETPMIDDEHNSSVRNVMAHECRRLGRRLWQTPRVWEQALAIRKLLLMQELST
jgi:hypothetical protein